ncbi:MAG: 50S ribosomal protein L6 [Parachlamydiales bacterium]|nr:50S ribosomal protein L6 [Parachlamydiales bacterium]
MSRLGKMPIPVAKATVTLGEREITVKGPKGTLQLELLPAINVKQEGEELIVSLSDGHEEYGNLHGLYRQLIRNMVHGVTEGFEKRLQMIGVGYRAAVQGPLLDLQLGYSHPTKLKIPEGIEVKVDKNTMIIITGADKQRVGQFAADVRSLRPPEPYKGKGIRHEGEYVRRKAGKAGKK